MQHRTDHSELMTTIENELVQLIPLSMDHKDALYHVASDPKIWEQHPKHDRWKKEVFEDFFDQAIKSELAFFVVDVGTGRCIGSSRYKRHNSIVSAVEIGWTFLALSHWGGLYNRAMKSLMVQNARPFFEHIILCIDADNKRSIKAAEKIGAQLIKDRTNPLFDKRPNYVTYVLPEKIKV